MEEALQQAAREEAETLRVEKARSEERAAQEARDAAMQAESRAFFAEQRRAREAAAAAAAAAAAEAQALTAQPRPERPGPVLALPRSQRDKLRETCLLQSDLQKFVRSFVLKHRRKPTATDLSDAAHTQVRTQLVRLEFLKYGTNSFAQAKVNALLNV